MLEKLREIEKRFDEIEIQMQDPATAANPSESRRLGKARAEIEDVVTVFRRHKRLLDELKESEELASDPEMKDLAEDEILRLKGQLTDSEDELKKLLIPKDPLDEKAVIVEIRPAAGGEEAGLFAGELFRMYTRFCERMRWKFEIVDHEEDGMGSLKFVTFNIHEKGAFSYLKHESGVHRVQRVPATESSGRTHTSTATVAVLPEAEEVDVEISDDDLEVSTFRSSSAGGQHMQKNETAIRVIHRPTGVVATCQDERSQLQNKIKAMSVIRAKLYQFELERQAKERGALRKGQLGSGDRSEKIRTYNFPQSRITDHRIGFQANNVVAFMDGDILPMLSALMQDEQARKLSESEG